MESVSITVLRGVSRPGLFWFYIPIDGPIEEDLQLDRGVLVHFATLFLLQR